MADDWKPGGKYRYHDHNNNQRNIKSDTISVLDIKQKESLRSMASSSSCSSSSSSTSSSGGSSSSEDDEEQWLIKHQHLLAELQKVQRKEQRARVRIAELRTSLREALKENEDLLKDMETMIVKYEELESKHDHLLSQQEKQTNTPQSSTTTAINTQEATSTALLKQQLEASQQQTQVWKDRAHQMKQQKKEFKKRCKQLERIIQSCSHCSTINNESTAKTTATATANSTSDGEEETKFTTTSAQDAARYFYPPPASANTDNLILRASAMDRLVAMAKHSSQSLVEPHPHSNSHPQHHPQHPQHHPHQHQHHPHKLPVAKSSSHHYHSASESRKQLNLQQQDCKNQDKAQDNKNHDKNQKEDKPSLEEHFVLQTQLATNASSTLTATDALSVAESYKQAKEIIQSRRRRRSLAAINFSENYYMAGEESGEEAGSLQGSLYDGSTVTSDSYLRHGSNDSVQLVIVPGASGDLEIKPLHGQGGSIILMGHDPNRRTSLGSQIIIPRNVMPHQPLLQPPE